MKSFLLSCALIVVGCGPSSGPQKGKASDGGADAIDMSRSSGDAGASDGGTTTLSDTPPSDFPSAPADAEINTSGHGSGTTTIPESQVPDEIAAMSISDSIGSGGGPLPQVFQTTAVDADGLCVARTERAGDAPADVECDWAYSCVTESGTRSRQGTKDLGSYCSPSRAAMRFGDSLGSYLSQSCLVYYYWFWCTW